MKDFNSQYQTVHPAFERFCRARVYGEMEYGDLMNDTLLIAHKGFKKLKNKDAFLSFLIGISIKVLANNSRKMKAERMPEKSDFIDGNMKTDLRVEINQLHSALSALPEPQRESLILFEINGFSIKEIAEIHEVGESAVKQRLRRGRLALAEILNETSINNSALS